MGTKDFVGVDFHKGRADGEGVDNQLSGRTATESAGRDHIDAMAVGQVQCFARTYRLVFDFDVTALDREGHTRKRRMPFGDGLAVDPGRAFAAVPDKDTRQAEYTGWQLGLLDRASALLNDGPAFSRAKEQRTDGLDGLCCDWEGERIQGQQVDQAKSN